MKLYLSGPMTGLPENNYPAFCQAAKTLRNAGFTVLNPAELDDIPIDEDWEKFLRRDLALMLNQGCNAVAVLQGWEKSKGARLEIYVARQLGMQIHDVTRLLKSLIPLTGTSALLNRSAKHHRVSAQAFEQRASHLTTLHIHDTANACQAMAATSNEIASELDSIFGK